MAKSAITLVTKDSNGEPKTIIIRKPNYSQSTEAQLYAATMFKKARESGMIVRDNLDKWLEEQNLWSKENKANVAKLEAEIEEKIEILEKKKKPDGTPVKLSEARELAIEVSLARVRLRVLLHKKQSYDEFTVEGAVDNARFDYLVSLCLFDDNGKRIFQDVEDYYENKEEPYAMEAAAKFASIYLDIDEDWQKKLPENDFLLKYKFVNDDLRFINKDGQPVNMKGDLVETQEAEKVVEDAAEFVDDVYN